MNTLLNILKSPWKILNKLSIWQRLAIALLFIIALQQCIPSGLIAYGSTLDGRSVQLHRVEKVKSDLQQKASTITLDFRDKKEKIASNKVGFTVDHAKTTQQFSVINTRDKFIPFGPVFKLLQKKNIQTTTKSDMAIMQSTARALAYSHSVKPKDATAIINETGQLTIESASLGRTYTEKNITDAIRTVKPYADMMAVPKALEEQPKIERTSFTSVQEELKTLKQHKLIIKYDGNTKEYSADIFSRWLEVTQTDTKEFVLKFKDDALHTQLDTVAKELNVAAGITQVTTVDGVETARNNGFSGRSLDIEQTKVVLQDWLKNPNSDGVQAKIAVVAPRVIITRVYSASSSGLQSKINAWLTANGGGRYQVAVQELGGQGRIASANVSQQTVMASTYKLFLAYAAYKQSENGSLSLSVQLSCGKTIQQGIEIMIVQSDNDCAIALGKYIGWAKVDQIIAASGFKNVILNNYDSTGRLSGDKMVNAGELAKFLVQLSGGSLINSSNTATLLGYMKRQVYREGIPAGSHGSIVADKVGFLEGYLHDAGIVYGKNSTYALVIMSSGSSWKNIANLSTAIYDIMND